MLHRRTSFCILMIVGLIITFIQMWLFNKPANTNFKDIKKPIILWWNDFGFNGFKSCGQFICYFTQDENFLTHSFLKAIIFYGSSMEYRNLPIPRGKNIQWGLLHEESPRNNPAFVYDDFLNLFNYSSTFSRYSDIISLQIPGIDELTSKKFYFSFEKKEILMKQNDLAPLLYIQSNCDTTNDRDDYIAELMKYIRVDAYGSCLNNRKLPESLQIDHLRTLYDDEFYNFVAKYKFTLAFENADCEDYITEKLWRPLIVGSIPIYYGSPSFKDWLPNEKSAISVRDFSSPKELANFIEKISINETLYNEYLSHKLIDKFSSLTNERLISLYRDKPKGFDFYDSLNEFECYICNAINNENKNRKYMMTRKQLNCTQPISALTQKVNPKNKWHNWWANGKCEAKLLAYHVVNNLKINETIFSEETARMYLNNKC
ncbi:alpha-(1,3)-fucosyltransferase 10 [Leptopilina boulardi]|uniref:alpha-(1,3)-fucosyltransferase 10 n=1 Tax=Leptopilina boulardi TaxID=63433 RepID=UPI0021F51C5E|nr:alpha-(1,3)-fucosyltransferase 10 [Leptopilina boulardi]XP_051165412.1 alpha-(1,3)-fucosyltransferase 10 [Leptopilina boulardi]